MAGRFILQEYNPGWVDIYRAEATKIKALLGNDFVAIHHVGSTAVSGMCAIPIIDIMLVIKDFSHFDEVAESLGSIGYIHKGDNDTAQRRFLIKGEYNRTHHIQIFEKDNKVDIERHLAVRDYLQSHPQEVKEFCAFKKKLFENFPGDAEAYYFSKQEMHRRIEQKALYWKNHENSVSTYMSFGMSVGMALGVGVGAIVGNIGIGMCAGMALGMGAGMLLGSLKK